MPIDKQEMSARGDIVKIFIPFVLLAATCSIAAAAGGNFQIERMATGSGTPAVGETNGTETAEHVADGAYHAPNFLPGFPTAATIWPREVPITCELDRATQRKTCSGYRVIPAIGRGEYIFVRPTEVSAPPPVTVSAPPEPKPVQVPVTVKKPLG